ncbi:countin-3-like [Watersipora subatra]|uniref:countin-3-like n=1 Tax=Watersipora subatra TaxID=2589382 RepID=UPI00355B631B
MAKQIALGVVVVIALVFAAEAGTVDSITNQKRWQGVEANFCPTCVSFSEQAINELLNIILNAGVVGGCSEVCSLLADKTGSQPLGQICSFLCDIVGVEVFSNLIQKADLDPIYFCELLNICPAMDGGDAMIATIGTSPMKGPAGTTFNVNVMIDTVNGTGTGEMDVDVETLDGVPLGSSFLLEAQAAGSHYNAKVQINATPDPSCDPMSQPCENWLPGNYTVTVAVCNGECNSKHPHSQVYDEKKTMFTITEN